MADKIIYRTKNGTIITPYRKYQCRDLEHNTSVYDRVYHKAIEMTGFMVNNYDGENDAFITHYLPEDYLATHFRNYQIHTVNEFKAKPVSKSFKMNKDIHLTDIQGKIANEITNAQDKYTREWFINLQTGAGKTVLGTYLTSKFGKKTMVVCFMIDILMQWKKTYREKTTIDPDRILDINSGKILDDIYFGTGDYSQYDIFLISPSLISMYLNKNPWTRFSKVIEELGIGLLIFDEGHRNMSTIVKVNALTNIKYTLYLSADYAQGDYQKEKLFYNIFRKTRIIKPEGEEARSLKHTKVIVVDYNSKPDVTESTMIYNKYGFSAEYYMDYQLRKGKIYEVLDEIIKIISNVKKPEWKTLILLEHIKHVDEVYAYLVNHNKIPGMIYGRYHSKISPEDKQAALDYANVIISTYKSFGTGMDVNSIKYVVSLNQCNKVNANQAAGRSRALPDGSDSIYFLVTDNGFKYCKQKTKVVLGYLSEQKLKEPPFVYHM